MQEHHPDVAVVMATGRRQRRDRRRPARRPARTATCSSRSGATSSPSTWPGRCAAGSSSWRTATTGCSARGAGARADRPSSRPRSAASRSRASELSRSREQTIERLCLAIEFRSRETGEHVRRIGLQRVARGRRRLGLDAARCEMIRLGAVLHDVGKIGIPDAILLKPGALTDAERTAHAGARGHRPPAAERLRQQAARSRGTDRVDASRALRRRTATRAGSPAKRDRGSRAGSPRWPTCSTRSRTTGSTASALPVDDAVERDAARARRPSSTPTSSTRSSTRSTTCSRPSRTDAQEYVNPMS